MKYRKQYLTILQEELKKAMGCTEPIAISYLSSKLQELLGEDVVNVDVYVSGNILKNVKSVVVPNTNGLRGIEAAVAIGVVGGNSDLELQCISKITSEEINDFEPLNEAKSKTVQKIFNTFSIPLNRRAELKAQLEVMFKTVEKGQEISDSSREYLYNILKEKSKKGFELDRKKKRLLFYLSIVILPTIQFCIFKIRSNCQMNSCFSWTSQ